MLVEYKILIPIVRDSDRQPHSADVVGRFRAALCSLSGGYTRGSNVCGYWNGIEDISEVYYVAIDGRSVEQLKHLLAAFGREFDQQCIYLAETGRAELLDCGLGRQGDDA